MFSGIISLDDISDKIHEATGQRKSITDKEYQELNEILENTAPFDKYEDLVEQFLSEKLNKLRFELKKTNFAQNLLTVMRNNLSQSNRSKKYPFEEFLSKFVSKIQKKKYPGLDIEV